MPRLQVMLHGYDQELTRYLIEGFTHGFRLDLDKSKVVPSKKLSRFNHQSARRHSEIVTQKLQKEIDAGRMIGPFVAPPYPDFHSSPLALVAKKVPGQWRLIHNLSFPHGGSVNDLIAREKGAVTYQTVDTVIESIVKVGPGCVLSKTDIQHAYKIIPVHGSDVPHLGLFWNEAYYCDLTLPMGCRTSCRIFESFSTALEWIGRHKGGLSHLHHVLDDFMMVSKAELAERQLRIFLDICKYLGIPVVVAKTESGTVLIFLGIEMDTVKMEARLPAEKLITCSTKIVDVLCKKSVTQLELMSLAGTLNFACSVVRPGRPFMRRIYNLACSVKHKFQHIRVTNSLKADLKLWLTFLRDFNGRALFPPIEWTLDTTAHCFTDACPQGYGLVYDTHWLYGEFDQVWSEKNICLLEAYPIMLMLHMFGRSLANRKLILHSDNKALVFILNKQSTRDSEIMVILRSIVLKAMEYNIIFKAVHVEGVLNTLADPLSRLQVDKFKSRAPQADEDPVPVPTRLLPGNFSLT